VKHKSHNALIVDWDFFFPIDRSWDWVTTEEVSPELLQALWIARAIPFDLSKEPLPTVVSTEGFWERFRYRFGGKLYVADSNKLAYTAVLAEFSDRIADTGVWLFDQHHDCGYKPDALERLAAAGVTCEDWMLALSHLTGTAALHVRYPAHRSDAFDAEPEPIINLDRRFDSLDDEMLPPFFDMVFVCRSGAWVPPWADEKFHQFVQSCPLAGLRIDLEVVPTRPLTPASES
jgi:hypothetical protein